MGNIVYKSIKELKPYKKNAKKHPKEQVEQIANSIKEFGFTQPVLIDKNNCVVAGHGRILGAKKAGLKEAKEYNDQTGLDVIVCNMIGDVVFSIRNGKEYRY